MTSDVDILSRILKFLTGESERICRLCLSSSENNGVYIEDVVQIKNNYLDERISYMDMIESVTKEKLPYELPFMLCSRCSEHVKTSYLFLQLCHHSNTEWNKALDTINKTMDLSENINTNIQTVFLIMNNEDKQILTSKRSLPIKNKTTSLTKLNNIIKSKKSYEKTKNNSQVICEECGVKLPSNSHLMKHMRVHSNQKYPCKLCYKVFPSQAQVNGHMERLHHPKKIKCPKCLKMFVNQRMLKCHDKSHHTAAICKICFVQFPSKNVLRQHLDKHDLNKCPRCDKSFLNKQCLKSHIKICGETDKLPQFFCDICNKGYIRKNGLRSHLKTDHGFGQVYKCNWCEKKFDAISKLKMHVVKHTKEKNFHCEQCGGKFVTQASLIYHVRLHTGEKPFHCDICGDSFLSASRRVEHIKRKHIGPTKECTICSSKFITQHQLTKHMERHKNPQSRLFIAEDDNNGVNNNIMQKTVQKSVYQPKILYF